MGLSIEIEVRDGATKRLGSLLEIYDHESINQAIGFAEVELFREHLIDYNAAHPNKLGGKRTHFYSQLAQAVEFETTGDGVRLGIDHIAARQRIEGGPIMPGVNNSFLTGQRTKYLTIPARAEAHGRRASEFEDLEIVFSKTGRPFALARRVQVLKKKKKGDIVVGGEILFWLRGDEGVFQLGEREVIPSDKDIEQRAHEALDELAKTIILS